MNFPRSLLLRTFGRPTGQLGRLGGVIMARSNLTCAEWVIGLLQVGPRDQVLEVGFGPGVAIELLARVPALHVSGIDPSAEMVEQATTRNVVAIASGRVELHLGSVERLPFADATFEKALAINSMQVWPDAVAGLRELCRVLTPGGRIALGFTRHSGQLKTAVAETVASGGFAKTLVVEAETDFCALATKP
jgi:ubiquinone/menaquinone biosynthesis C-methylase UbiE